MNQLNNQVAGQSAAIGGGVFASFLNTIVQAISQIGANVFV
jgi:hypothetical protein